MNKLKKDNVLNFPSKMTEIEREVEAIVFAAATAFVAVSSAVVFAVATASATAVRRC